MTPKKAKRPIYEVYNERTDFICGFTHDRADADKLAKEFDLPESAVAPISWNYSIRLYADNKVPAMNIHLDPEWWAVADAEKDADRTVQVVNIGTGQVVSEWQQNEWIRVCSDSTRDRFHFGDISFEETVQQYNDEQAHLRQPFRATVQYAGGAA